MPEQRRSLEKPTDSCAVGVTGLTMFFITQPCCSRRLSPPFSLSAKGRVDWADNWLYVLPFTLIGLLLAMALNIVGVGTGRWLQNVGGVSIFFPVFSWWPWVFTASPPAHRRTR
jgi:hypothetical protein